MVACRHAAHNNYEEPCTCCVRLRACEYSVCYPCAFCFVNSTYIYAIHHTYVPFFLKVRHIDFKFLLKADDDTFVCVERLANFLHDQPEETKDRLYAGVPTYCNDPTHLPKDVRTAEMLL